MILRKASRFSIRWVWVVVLGFSGRGCIGVEDKNSQLETGFTSGYFNSSWTLQSITVGLPTSIKVSVDQDDGWQLLLLCQTNATVGEVVSKENTWSVVELADTCNNGINANGPACFATTRTIAATFTPGPETGPYTNMFFCLMIAALDGDKMVCDSYSPFFNIHSGIPQPDAGDRSSTPTTPDGSTDGEFPATPTEPIHLVHQSLILGVSEPTTTSIAVPAVDSSSAATTSIVSFASAIVPSASVTETGISSPTPTGSSSPASQAQITTSLKSEHLSTAAKAGIALGSLALTGVLLLVAIFLLRRTKQTRRLDPIHYDNNNNDEIPDTTASHVLLTRHLHNTSRDLTAEKEIAMTSVTPVDSPTNEYAANRRSIPPLSNNPTGGFEVHSSPFAEIEPPPIQPHPPSSPPPSTQLSRGVSNSSAIISPRTPGGKGSDASGRFGNASASASGEGSGEGRFLRSIGMTEEEWEEERRIDLAIAEAEADAERGRS